MDEKRNAQAQVPTSSEQSSLRPIAVPLAVRWREFRVQIIPPLAFGGALFLAGVLWQKAVLPVAVAPSADPLPGLGLAQAPDSASGNSAMHQASAGETNAMAKTPGADSP